MTARAKPQSSVVVLEDRPDFFLRQRGSGRIVHEGARMQMAEAVIGADPNVSATVLNQRARAEVGEAIPYLIVLRILARDAAYSFIGGDPHAPSLLCRNARTKLLVNLARSGVVDYAAMSKAVDSAAVSADPKITGAIAEDIADRHVR